MAARADPQVKRLTVVVFDGTPLGIMSFTIGVFDMAKHYGVLPDLDLRVVAGEPAAALALRRPELRRSVRPGRGPGRCPDRRLRLAGSRRGATAAAAGGAARGARGRRAGRGPVLGHVRAGRGLDAGRPARHHALGAGWRLAERYPKIDVRAEPLCIDDGGVLTAGGGAAGMDLGLHLLRAQYGAAVANRLARYMVVPPHRFGDQAKYVETPLPVLDETDPVSGALAWALGRLDQARRSSGSPAGADQPAELRPEVPRSSPAPLRPPG